MKNSTAYIVGTGAHLPERVVTNEELAEVLKLHPDRIFKSSGIRRRRWVTEGTSTSLLAAVALEQALCNASLHADEIDYLIFGTMTPDRFIPGTAPALQKLLELREVPCLDIREACCNALYALQLSKALIAGKVARNVAICLAEAQSPFLELSPEAATLSMLFADGAAALIVSNKPQASSLEIVEVSLATDGSYVDDLGIRCPGTEFGTSRSNSPCRNPGDYAPRMNGQSVILQASRRMGAAARDILDRHHVSPGDIRWVVPHQANANLLAQVARGLGLSTTNTEIVSVLEDLGNTSSAAMGIALDKLRRSGQIKAGDNLLLPAFAAGFTWGAGLCRAGQ
jgi:3-oxoacyl-[acyl-carrier-protein] synthase III